MIIAHQLAKYYGPHAAVEGLSLSVARGEVVGLLGLNGAGKTTTLRILSGLLVPTSGTVHLGGVAMAQEPERARAQVGFLPETPPLYPEMSVRGFLRFVARIKGVPKPRLYANIDRALAATDLWAVQDARIGGLSHGYARRIGIAQAIVHSPAVILLDEPTSGLDPLQVVHMRKLIRSLRGAHTLVVSSHLLTEIHALCDRIVVLSEGRVAASGTEAELAASFGAHVHVRVHVRGTSQALRQALASLDAVQSVTLAAAEAGYAVAEVALHHDAREQVAQALVQAGLGLRELTRVREGLEDTFLRLLGQAPATQAPPADLQEASPWAP